MGILAIDLIAAILALAAMAFAVRKWHIVQDHRQILSVIQSALKERKALGIGILTGLFYLAVFLILGGRGGRIHFMFGRFIWNTTPGEMLAGFFLAVLVMISMTLFVYGVGVMGGIQAGKKSGMGFFGSFLALLAAFCP